MLAENIYINVRRSFHPVPELSLQQRDHPNYPCIIQYILPAVFHTVYIPLSGWWGALSFSIRLISDCSMSPWGRTVSTSWAITTRLSPAWQQQIVAETRRLGSVWWHISHCVGLVLGGLGSNLSPEAGPTCLFNLLLIFNLLSDSSQCFYPESSLRIPFLHTFVSSPLFKQQTQMSVCRTTPVSPTSAALTQLGATSVRDGLPAPRDTTSTMTFAKVHRTLSESKYWLPPTKIVL